MVLVEADRPVRGGPGSDQHLLRAQKPQMPDQSAANPASLSTRQSVRVANEVDLAYPLKAHHANQCPTLLIAPEYDPGVNLAIELVSRHIGIVPPIGRDHTAIDLGGSIDDRGNGGAFSIKTDADVAHQSRGLSKGWAQTGSSNFSRPGSIATPSAMINNQLAVNGRIVTC